MKTFHLLVATAALALSGQAMSANLLDNGGFEGPPGSWDTDFGPGGGTAPVVIAYGQSSGYPTGAFGEAVTAAPNGGLQGAYFSSDTANPHTISQSVNVENGVSYYLSFDYYVPLNGYNNPFDAELAFLIEGVQRGDSLIAGTGNTIVPQTWYNFTTTWTADVTGPVDVAFAFYGGGRTAADFVVDNVSMTAVPEPATWALMIGGFGLAGMQLRRRRATVSFA